MHGPVEERVFLPLVSGFTRSKYTNLTPKKKWQTNKQQQHNMFVLLLIKFNIS